MVGRLRSFLAWTLSAALALAPVTEAVAQSRNSFRPIFQPGGGVSSSTNKPAVGATTATGQVPAGASASCKRNGSVTGSASVTAQGTVTCTFGSAIVAGDQFSIPWTLTGESPAATASNGPPTPVTAPANTALPAISGTPQVGQTLASSTGSWSGSPTSYAYAWSAGGTQVQAGTSNSYTAQAADVGKTITVSVTASNTAGSASATSAATSAVTNAVQALNTIYTSGLLTNGLASSGIINGASPGSTITSNLSGLTVNSAARTYSWDGTGAAGSTANALTETPTSGTAKNSPAIVLAASTGNLKVSGRQFFGGEPAMFLILAGYASTSSLTVTSDDGTVFTVGANSQGYPLANGTFPTVTTNTPRTLTVTELKSDSTTSVSTVAVMVSPIPAAPTTTVAKATAARIQASVAARKPLNVGSNPPTISLNTGASTVNGRSLAAGGSIAASAVPDGKSGTAGQTALGATNGGYIYADTTQGLTQNTYANGGSKRWVYTGTVGSHFDFKLSYPGGNTVSNTTQVLVTYTEDADSASPTWYRATVRPSTQSTTVQYFDVTFPSAPAGAGKRAVEVYLPQGNLITGFNFEAGATIAAYNDNRIAGAGWNDSYVFGQALLDMTYGVPMHVTMDALGSPNAVSFGHRTNAWARIGGTTGVHAYVADRIGSNPYGFDESTRFGFLDVVSGHMSINDNTLGNYNSVSTSNKFVNQNGNFVVGTTTLKNLLVLAFRRMRLMQPTAFITIDTAWASPDAVPSSAYVAILQSAFDQVFGSDPLADMLDFLGGNYRWMGANTPVTTFTAPLVAAGAIGSSQYFPPQTASITATISGATLNVSALNSGVRIEPGMVPTINGLPCRILDYGTGTGAAGTYTLEYAPGDNATATTYSVGGDYPHPNQLGATKNGIEIANAVTFGVGKAAALQ